MKNISALLIALFILSLSACVKVEETPALCQKVPVKPITESDAYTASLNTSITVKLLNLESGVNYTIEGPDGYTSSVYPFIVNINSNSKTGIYTIYGVGYSSRCKGEKTTISIETETNLPTCGMAANTYSMNNATPTQLQEGEIIPYSDHYLFKCSGNNNGVYLYLKNLPSKTNTETFTVKDKDELHLESGECTVKQLIINVGNYYGYTGTVYTSYKNGKYQATFCDVTMRDGIYTMYNNTRGNLYIRE